MNEDNNRTNELYNTKVRQAISDEYVRCSKEKSRVIKSIEQISFRLANEKDVLTYSEYLELKNETEYLQRRAGELQIEIDTWDKARELCLNVADELK